MKCPLFKEKCYENECAWYLCRDYGGREMQERAVRIIAGALSQIEAYQ